MWYYRMRLRNKLLQAFYRPRAARTGLLDVPSKTLSVFDELENSIEEKITPLLSDLFK
ncbi:MAG: hypothetical protein FWC89_02055 [Defluviitaleaceae bacterium]|nr:hypothetical protein [Defluviitaleaceae bacterium]